MSKLEARLTYKDGQKSAWRDVDEELTKEVRMVRDMNLLGDYMIRDKVTFKVVAVVSGKESRNQKVKVENNHE